MARYSIQEVLEQMREVGLRLLRHPETAEAGAGVLEWHETLVDCADLEERHQATLDELEDMRRTLDDAIEEKAALYLRATRI